MVIPAIIPIGTENGILTTESRIDDRTATMRATRSCPRKKADTA